MSVLTSDSRPETSIDLRPTRILRLTLVLSIAGLGSLAVLWYLYFSDFQGRFEQFSKKEMALSKKVSAFKDTVSLYRTTVMSASVKKGGDFADMQQIPLLYEKLRQQIKALEREALLYEKQHWVEMTGEIATHLENMHVFALMMPEEFKEDYFEALDSYAALDGINQQLEAQIKLLEEDFYAGIDRLKAELRERLWVLIYGNTAIIFCLVLMLYVVFYKITHKSRLNRLLEAKVSEQVAQNREKDRMLFQQARLKAMGELVGNIAHQWRQPLNALSVLMQNQKRFFERGELDGERMEKATNRAKEIVAQMSQTIDEFRGFFKPDGRQESFVVRECVAQSIHLVESVYAQDGISFQLESDQDVMIHSYRQELSQVLITLFSNARDAIEESGVEHGNIRVHICHGEGQVTLKIMDNGGGVPEEILEKVFEPYFSTKEEGKGDGVGLHMSRVIIEEHLGGSIVLENIDNGACVRISLPASGLQGETV